MYSLNRDEIDGIPSKQLSELIHEEFKSDKNKYCVLGFDIYKYSEMEIDAQTLLPLVFSEVKEKALKEAFNNNKWLFQYYKSIDELSAKYIDTGDGGFIILNNPLEAIIILIYFCIFLRIYNFDPQFENYYEIIKEINIRFAITYNNCYEYNHNYYGQSIIECARIMSKDKLNRLIIDKNTHNFFMNNFIGVENLSSINIDLLKESKYFKSYDFSINNEDFFFDNKDQAVISNCIELKCSQLIEKKTILDIYVVFLEVSIKIDSGGNKIKISVGNLNTDGLQYE